MRYERRVTPLQCPFFRFFLRDEEKIVTGIVVTGLGWEKWWFEKKGKEWKKKKKISFANGGKVLWSITGKKEKKGKKIISFANRGRVLRPVTDKLRSPIIPGATKKKWMCQPCDSGLIVLGYVFLVANWVYMLKIALFTVRLVVPPNR